MGLDMYLYKKTYIGANHDFNEITGTIELKKVDTPIDIKLDRVVYITEAVGYWRKANAIHRWFVQNVQDGKDDCEDYFVSTDKLIQLLDLVDKVLKDHSKATELLPTQEGFFFGNTAYGDDYFEDLVITKAILKMALKEGGDFEYHSSW